MLKLSSHGGKNRFASVKPGNPRPHRLVLLAKHFSLVAVVGLLPMLSLSAAGAAGKDGRSVYNTSCVACHAPGNVMVSSPKLGDKDEWARRLHKGLDQTTDNAMKGLGAMPAKGGCMECTREEIRSAIQYMAK